MKKNFISHPAPYTYEYLTEEPAPLFRRRFTVREGIDTARLSVCALGLGEIFINGRPVTKDRFLAPYGDYRKTLWYTEHDVTILLKVGENVAAAALGNGFYNESLHTAWVFNDAPWRDVPKLLFRLVITYLDGSEEIIEGDERWRTDRACSPYRYNQLRCGETYDANFATDWMLPDFDDSDWIPAVFADAPAGELRLCPAPPIRECTTYECISMRKNASGSYTFDFGQNMSGCIRLRAKQPKGTRLRIIYAEQIEADGSRRDNRLTNPHFYRDCVTQTCEMVCSGGEDVWKPCFSYYGFRYVIIEGFVDAPAPTDATAYFIHQDVTIRSRFRCSDGTLNKLFEFSRLSTLSNLFYMPTDCPTREKLGWANDAQASCEQFIQNYDMRGFYEKWMQDIIDSVSVEGNLPGIIPTGGWGYHWGNGPVSTGVMYEIPYRMWQYTGDTSMLVKTLPAMVTHLDFLETRRDAETGLIADGLSDWAGPFDGEHPNPTPLPFSTHLLVIKMTRIAALAAGFAEDADLAAALVEREQRLTEEFRAVYVKDDSVTVKSQTGLSMALVLGIIEPTEAVRAELLAAIEAHDYHFHLGMLGMQYIFKACDMVGLHDAAYKLLTAEGYPSFREWFRSDATTMYEKWYDDESKNHHMYSCPIAWFHNTLLGIGQTAALYTRHEITIAPHFLGALTFAEGEYMTDAGRFAVSWKRGGGRIALTVTVPAGITATIAPQNARFADTETVTVCGGTHTFVLTEA